MLANRTCATPMQHLNRCNLRTTEQRKHTCNLRTVVQRKNICNLRTVLQRKNMHSARGHAEAERKHSPASRLLRILCEAQILVFTPIHCRSRLAGEPDLRCANAAAEQMQSPHDRAAKDTCNLRTVLQRKNMHSARGHAEAERKHSPASRLLRILCEAQILVSTSIYCRSRLAGELCGSGDIAASGQMHSPASRLLQVLWVTRPSSNSTHPIQRRK